MFNSTEIKFLKSELNHYVIKAQSLLENPDVEGTKRENIESKLITAVSVVNKIMHAMPDKEEKSALSRVLIVDDVESMRKIHRHYLMECGFKNVDLAEDGSRAFQMLTKANELGKPYNLVISDWEMPKTSGLELLKMVRTDKSLWRVPFYLISALGEKRHIVKGINMGATGYMNKPVNQKMIIDVFKDYLAS